MKKVIVIYGTRYGATQDISVKISEILKEKNIDVTLVNILDEKSPSFIDYDGVLIGTGIKMSMWTKSIKKFVKRNLDNLKNRKFKLGFYISCGTASKKEKIQEAVDKYILKKADKIGLKLDLYDAFGPIYDLRENSNLGKISRSGIEDSLKEEGWEIVEKKKYDFVDCAILKSTQPIVIILSV